MTSGLVHNMVGFPWPRLAQGIPALLTSASEHQGDGPHHVREQGAGMSLLHGLELQVAVLWCTLWMSRTAAELQALEAVPLPRVFMSTADDTSFGPSPHLLASLPAGVAVW